MTPPLSSTAPLSTVTPARITILGLTPTIVAALVVVLALCAPVSVSAQPKTLTVSAAASLGDVLGDLAKRYESVGGVSVRINLGGSNTLARQIVEGAPVDLFISADEAQMDVVQKAGRLAAGWRAALLTNRLVVIVPAGAGPALAAARDLAAPAVRRLAMGNPDAVPAGVYARQWLERQAVWTAVHSKVVPLPTVRAVLAAVREGRADAGVVYATDARTERAVRIAFEVPPDDAPFISYPAAVVSGPREVEAATFLRYLRSPEARTVFEAAGFGVLTPR